MPQPNVAKRLECVELAPAFEHAGWPESASKLAALQTLREVRQPRADRYGTMTRKRDRWIEKAAGTWPMSSPSICSGAPVGLVSVSDGA